MVMQFVNDKGFLYAIMPIHHFTLKSHPLDIWTLENYVKDYLTEARINDRIKTILHNNLHKPLLNEKINNIDLLQDYIFILQSGKVIVNFACVIGEYEAIRDYSERDFLTLLKVLYSNEVAQNPLGYKIYADRLVQKLDDLEYILHNGKD